MKKFKKVKVGDIGFNYHNDQVEVLAKYSKKEIDDTIISQYGIDKGEYLENRDYIVVKSIIYRTEDLFVYGDDGVYVPKNSEVSKFILEENETEFLVESIQFILDNCENVIKTSNNDYTFNRDKVENLKVRLMEFGNMYEE